MKKLILLIGLIMFTSINVESLETIINTDLPVCKIIKIKELNANQKRFKKLGREVVLLEKVKTPTPCYGEIIINYDCTYKGEFENREKSGYGELWCSHAINTQLWEKGKLVKNYNSIELRLLKIELGIIKTVQEEFYCEGIEGNAYKSPAGCFNNISITKEEYLNKIENNNNTDLSDVEVFCYNKNQLLWNDSLTSKPLVEFNFFLEENLNEYIGIRLWEDRIEAHTIFSARQIWIKIICC